MVPALRQLHEITRSFIKQTYQKQDKVRIHAEMTFEALAMSVWLCFCRTWKFEFRNERGNKLEKHFDKYSLVMYHKQTVQVGMLCCVPYVCVCVYMYKSAVSGVIYFILSFL